MTYAYELPSKNAFSEMMFDESISWESYANLLLAAVVDIDYSPRVDPKTGTVGHAFTAVEAVEYWITHRVNADLEVPFSSDSYSYRSHDGLATRTFLKPLLAEHVLVAYGRSAARPFSRELAKRKIGMTVRDPKVRRSASEAIDAASTEYEANTIVRGVLSSI